MSALDERERRKGAGDRRHIEARSRERDKGEERKKEERKKGRA
jgi:hypothetical protein